MTGFFLLDDELMEELTDDVLLVDDALDDTELALEELLVDTELLTALVVTEDDVDEDSTVP